MHFVAQRAPSLQLLSLSSVEAATEGQDRILRLCIKPSDYPHHLARAHQNTSRIHLSGQQTAQSLFRLGVYWPTVHEDAHTFVRGCFHCQLIQPVPYGTLYQVMIAPKWSRYIVEYLQSPIFPANMKLARRRAIESEAQEYNLIGNQL